MIKRIFNFIDFFFKLDFFTKWKEYNNLAKIIKSIPKRNLLNKIIVINTIRTHDIKHLDNALLLGTTLALNGAKVKILLDDGILTHWDTYQIDALPMNINNIEKYSLNPSHIFYKEYKNFLKIIFKKILIKKALRTFNIKNLEILYYSEILDREKLNYANVEELKKHAKSSTIRFFKTCNLDYNTRFVKYYYYLSLKNAILNRNIGEYILSKINPNIFFTIHAKYSTHGPAFEFLEQNGIKCILNVGHLTHLTNKNKVFFSDIKWELLSSSRYWGRYKNILVTEKMKKNVEEFFEKRLKGFCLDKQGSGVKYHSSKDKEMIFKIKKDDSIKYHIAMFPNVIWDANTKDRHIAFDGYLDWLVTTINYVINRKDIKLYIRAHPAETIWCKTSDRVIDLIKEKISLKNVNNIIVIPPEKKVNTYDFLKSGIDLAIVYDGFLGIEMPYLKIPTITCVKGGLFSVEGGNFTVVNKEEYLNFLINIDKVIEDFHYNFNIYRNNIIRYLYWYLNENLIKITSKNSDYMKLTKNDFNLDEKFITLLN